MEADALKAQHQGTIVGPKSVKREPRWPIAIALLAVGGLYLALPHFLSFGPRWLLIVLVIAFQAPMFLLPEVLKSKIVPILEHILLGIITCYMVISIYLLVHALPSQAESAKRLLGSAIALWITNLIVFANWYWLLDAGGPRQRNLRSGHTDGALLFPQMMLPSDLREEMHISEWSPHFLDYLFFAFNTSTAFSPTDAPPLSRWAKLLMMIQSLISLTIITLLAARAVNIF